MLALTVLAGILVILVLEVAVFNHGYWETRGLHETVVAEDVTVTSDSAIDISPPQPLDVKTIAFRGARAKGTFLLTMFDENKRQGFQDELPFNLAHGKSSVFRLHLYGQTEGLSLKLAGADADSGEEQPDVHLDSIVLNQPIPFEISWVRLMGIVFLWLLVVGFSPARQWLGRSVEERNLSFIMAGVVAAFVVLCTVLALAQPSKLGSLECSEDATIICRQPKVSSQYAELARSFADGRVDLEIEPDESLLALEDPYDNYTRGEATEGRFLWDTAFYQGRYYVYFGVLPVLVFHLPFYLLTGIDFPTSAAGLVCLGFFAAGASALLLASARRWFPQSGYWVILAQIACLLGSLPALVVHDLRIYSTPIIMGLALLAWGAYVIVKSYSRPRLLPLAAFLFALIVACRPQLLAFALVAASFALPALLRVPSRKQRLSLGLSCLVVVLAVFAAIGLYNHARFGSPFDFGANYNLTGNNMTLRPHSLDGTLLGAFTYLFQPIKLDPMFPFLTGVDIASSQYFGYLVRETMFGGIFWISPITLLAFSLLSRKRKRLCALAAGVLAAGLVVAVFDSQAAGLLARYYLDFAFPLSLMGCVAFLYWMNGDNRELKHLVAKLAVCFVLVSILANVAIEFTWYFATIRGKGFLVDAFL